MELNELLEYFINIVNVETVCPFCGSREIIAVNDEDYYDWMHGKRVQHAFPYLNANQRERLVTGICDKCWDDMWGE